MGRYMITVEYDGRNYDGWQAQEGRKTIEGTIESAIYNVTQEQVTIFGSGRTDSGVNAIGQTAHFDLSKDIECDTLLKAINFYLPCDIAVKNVVKRDPDFHARYDVKVKTYLYKIYNSKVRSPLREGRYYHCSYNLDIDSMSKAAKYLIGEHDFKGMMSLGSSVKTTVRTIYDVKIIKEGEEISVFVSGSGFLYNMVRIIVGTLVDIGRGKKTPSDMQRLVEEGDRKLQGAVAPAYGLYLYSVEY